MNITSDPWAVGNYSFNVSYSGDGNFTAADASGFFLNVTQNSVNITTGERDCL